MNDRIGFMQGRLSPMVDGRIQAFPRDAWQTEFAAARRIGLRQMEWTLDQDGLHENPLMTDSGRAEIAVLCSRNEVAIPSLTGDCFMQAPFWKANPEVRRRLAEDFRAVVAACALVGITIIVVPLVDNGRLDNAEQEEILVKALVAQSQRLESAGIRVAFETDHPPAALARFIGQFDAGVFGVNYDTGNSAAMGFDPDEEFAAFGRRIVNVHIKDRLLGGSTVPLGTGAADFGRVFAGLSRLGYQGNLILQTARAADGDHAGVLARYRDFVAERMGRRAA